MQQALRNINTRKEKKDARILIFWLYVTRKLVINVSMAINLLKFHACHVTNGVDFCLQYEP